MSTLKHYSWSAIDKFGTQVLSFVGNILIARQLSPDDYGLIAMLAIFMAIAWNFTESGFSDWLIRDKAATKNDFSIIFLHNVFFGLLLYLVLFFSAPYIANFYGKPELTAITRVLGVNLILKSLFITELVRLQKELAFKKIASIHLISNTLAIIIAFAMAKMGVGYWALVGQVVCASILQLLLIIFLNKWRPSFYFNWKKYKTMSSFGLNMLVSYFTNQIGSNLYAVFIGKTYTTASLGFFNQGNKINTMAFQGLNGVILNTSYTLLAKEEDKVKRKQMYVNIMSYFFFFYATLNLFLMGGATDIIHLLFGEKWLPTAPLLQLMLISYLLLPIIPLNTNIIKIENKSGLYRNLTFTRNGLYLLALLVTYKISLEWIIYGQIIANFIIAAIFMFFCGKYINLYFWEQTKIALKQLSIPLIAMLAAYFFVDYLEITWLWKLIIYSITFVSLFIIGNVVTKNKQFKSLLKKLKRA